MKYIDLHCDALTTEGVSVVTKENLTAGGCALQCFAAFLREGEGFPRALALFDRFDALCREAGYAVGRAGDRRPGAALTVEGGHALGGERSRLELFASRGVRMMTLVWNFENELGFPNFDRLAPLRRENVRGLKPFGFEAVERMLDLFILPDVSHGSDKLLFDVSDICRRRGAPFVASHSGAAAVFPHARNLTDEGIRAVAESGGVVGLDFCAAFLSSDSSRSGQREALLAHAAHILDAGGEETLAIGSDFDGAPPNPYLESPARMPDFLDCLVKKFGARIAEKIAFSNAYRVLFPTGEGRGE